tara:strand:- start:618 stop:986 length:369 start_codon:yes stop_codon:yes gene_type:complete
MVLGEIVAGIEAINKLLDAPLKARTAFRLGKLSKELAPHFETYEKVRGELLEKFGEKVDSDDENGQVQYSFANGTAEKFQTELMAMLEEKVDVKVRKIKVAELNGANLTARDMMALEWLIAD